MKLTVQPWLHLVFVWSLSPDSLVQVVGLLFNIEPVLQKNYSFYSRFFTAFEICEVRFSYNGHTAVFFVFTIPHLVDRIS